MYYLIDYTLPNFKVCARPGGTAPDVIPLLEDLNICNSDQYARDLNGRIHQRLMYPDTVVRNLKSSTFITDSPLLVMYYLIGISAMVVRGRLIMDCSLYRKKDGEERVVSVMTISNCSAPRTGCFYIRPGDSSEVIWDRCICIILFLFYFISCDNHY